MGLFSSETPQAQRVQRAGIDLKCDHCGHDLFHQGSAKFHTYMEGASLLGVAGFQESATFYACERCGKMQLFR